jgi:hypothetical protein
MPSIAKKIGEGFQLQLQLKMQKTSLNITSHLSMWLNRSNTCISDR